MASTRAVLMAFFLAVAYPAQAVPPEACELGRAATVTGKILSVVARDSAWSIWLKRNSNECSIAAVVVTAKTLAAACKPGSRVTATGTVDADTLRSDPTSVMCTP